MLLLLIGAEQVIPGQECLHSDKGAQECMLETKSCFFDSSATCMVHPCHDPTKCYVHSAMTNIALIWLCRFQRKNGKST